MIFPIELEPFSVSVTGMVNTILLVIGLPVLGRLTWSTSKLTEAIKELKTVVLGVEDQGGLARRVEGIAATNHKLNNEMIAMRSEINMLKKNFEVTE